MSRSVALFFVLVALLPAALPTFFLAIAHAVGPSHALVQVQIVHRHGARTPLVTFNQSAICGDEFACGDLNRPGQTMLKNVGAFLRERYTKDAAVVDPAAPFLTSDAYNLTVSYSRSTDILRTLQSSVALLRGLFPDMDAYYPVVHTVAMKQDSILNTGVKPAVALLKEYGKVEEKKACLPIVDKYFPSFTALVGIAREVHSEGYCKKMEKRHKCAKTLCDIGRSYESQGILPSYPKLTANLGNLCQVSLQLSRLRYMYDQMRESHVKQGSVGQELAQELVANAQALVQRRNVSTAAAVPAGSIDYKILEYSAHDSTIAPLAATLGDNDSEDGMLPPYATTYVFELLEKKTESEKAVSDGNRAYFMRVLRGYPGLAPETGFFFSWRPFTFRCMDAQNRVYTAVDNNTCPLADFIRYVDFSRPGDEAGMCYIDPVIWKRAACTRADAVRAVHKESSGASSDAEDGFETDLSEACRAYRQRCPKYACRAGYLLDALTFRCLARKESAAAASIVDETFFSHPRVRAVCGLSFVVGCLAFSVGIDRVMGPCGGREGEKERDEKHNPFTSHVDARSFHTVTSLGRGAAASAVRMRGGGTSGRSSSGCRQEVTACPLSGTV